MSSLSGIPEKVTASQVVDDLLSPSFSTK